MENNKRRRFEYKVTLGKDINGNLLRKSFYSTKSRGDAKRKAEKFKAKYELELLCGGEQLHAKVLFKDWAIKCIESYKKPYVTASSYRGTYLAPVQNHLIPYFGDSDLNSIRPIQVQEYINQAAQKYSPETIKKDFTILSFIFQQAVNNGLCQKNPILSTIRIPKVKRATKTAFTQEEYETAYEFAKQHRNGLSIMVLMETGISRSELLGLKWKDIDIGNRVIHIRQGLVSYQNSDNNAWITAESALKNDYRRRDVPLIDEDLIRRLEQKAQSNATCEIGVSEYVFGSPLGKPYQPNNWRNRIYVPFMNDLVNAHPELPMLSPHELRHTRATLWLAQGISPLMVAKLLGHSDVRMLAKVYDHTTVDTLRNAILASKNSTPTG